MKDAHKIARTIEDEVRVLEDKKSRIIDLLINEQISERDKDIKMAEIEGEMSKLLLRKAELSIENEDKEKII